MTDSETDLSNSEAIGSLMRHRRRALGFTQQRLADLSGVSHKFINEVEQGKETAAIGKVMRVLHRLGIDLIGRQR
jgi:HTH-type transcriptional regulator / antitoxin HipB